jgi:hypothetical protein
MYRGIHKELYKKKAHTDKALYWACSEGRLSTVQRVHESGRSLDETFGYTNRWDKRNIARPRFTPLNSAISAGHFDIAQFLVEHGANVNIPDDSGYADQSCFKVHPINNALIKLRKVEQPAGWDIAAATGLVELLLGCGAFANQISLLPPHPLTGEQAKLRPLCQAMCEGVPAETARLLLASGARQKTGNCEPRVFYAIPRTPLERLIEESRIGGPFDQEIPLKFRYLLDHWPKGRAVRVFKNEILRSFSNPTECQLELLKIAVTHGISFIEWPTAVKRLEGNIARLRHPAIPRLFRRPVSGVAYGKEMINIILSAKAQVEQERGINLT